MYNVKESRSYSQKGKELRSAGDTIFLKHHGIIFQLQHPPCFTTVGNSKRVAMRRGICPTLPSSATEHNRLPSTRERWRLCSGCQELGLSASIFLVRKGEEDPNPENIYNPMTLDMRPWNLIANSTECSLCQLIVHGTQMASEDWLAGGTPWQCELISRRLRGHYPRDEEDIRVLEFHVQYNWGSVRGLLVPIDVEQVRRWLQQCETQHKERCQHTKTAQFNKLRADFLVINVQAQCLSELPESGRYIALSYVWGGVDQVKTTMDNLQDFLIPGALDRVSNTIPKAINDAMELVKQLGEKYLWVDALCIVQDDQSTKQSMIDHMHIIYANAYVTVFAASGNNSNAGLPGVSPSSRKMDQVVAPVAHDLTFIHPMPFTTIKKSAWATRGWTSYQEYFFSPRRLVFTEGQVIYQCNTIRWQEDLAQEHMAPHLLSFQVDHSGRGLGWEPPTCRFPNYPKNRWSHHHYLTYLTTYLDRKLTYDNDILNAFAGIINDAKEGGMTTFFGLTKDYFGLDMLWKHSTWATRRSGFPSWTWAGWKGCIVHHDRGKYSSEEEWIHSNSWIHWYVYDEKDGGFSILASGHRPESEKVVGKEESRMAESNNLQNEMRQESTISGTSDAKVSNSGGGNKLVALLARLSLNGADKRHQPAPYLSRTTVSQLWTGPP
ncbi:putative oxidoreductase YhdF [Fusarium oxysporum f. sp. albedinis]|nr:putative oxidoreductase YhdF [Fusarium oxysporum f. sp. albedinis]